MCTLLLRAKTKKTTKKSLLLRLEQGPEVWGQFGALGRHEWLMIPKYTPSFLPQSRVASVYQEAVTPQKRRLAEYLWEASPHQIPEEQCCPLSGLFTHWADSACLWARTIILMVLAVWFCSGCHDKVPHTGVWNNRILFSCSSESWKSKIKVSTAFVSSEASSSPWL